MFRSGCRMYELRCIHFCGCRQSRELYCRSNAAEGCCWVLPYIKPHVHVRSLNLEVINRSQDEDYFACELWFLTSFMLFLFSRSNLNNVKKKPSIRQLNEYKSTNSQASGDGFPP